MEADIRRLDEQLAQMKELLAAAEEEKNGASGRVEALTAQRDEAQKLADGLQTDLSAVSKEIELQTGSMDELSAKREELTELFNQAGMAHIALTTEAEGLENAITELNDRLASGGSRAEELRASIAALEQHIEELMGLSDEIARKAAACREGESQPATRCAFFQHQSDAGFA